MVRYKNEEEKNKEMRVYLKNQLTKKKKCLRFYIKRCIYK